MEDCNLREATWEDRDLLYEWRNDAAVRSASFRSQEVSVAEYEAWLKKKLADPASSIYILEVKGKPMGQVRLDRQDKKAFIPYDVSAPFRGQGYGKLLLTLVEQEAAKESLVLVGQVKKDNIASQVIFQSLGYEESEQSDCFEYRKTAADVLLRKTCVSRGGVLLLTNNRNAIPLFHWLEDCVITQIYSGVVTLDMLRGCRPSLIVSYNYTYIIPEDIIDFMDGNLVNLHISYLPWNRGAYPNLWSFLENTPKGVTIHRLEKGLDTGAVITQKEMFFDETVETLASSHRKLNEEIVKLFRKHWAEIYGRTYQAIPQKGKGSYHSLKDMKDLLRSRKIENIDWNMTIADFKRLMGIERTGRYAEQGEAVHHSGDVR